MIQEWGTFEPGPPFENFLCALLPTTYGREKNITPPVRRNPKRNSSYTRAFGDGPRNFEPGQVMETTDELAPPLQTSTLHQREDVCVLDRFNVHRFPTRQVFNGTRLELMTASQESVWFP
ncbi:hypothetical protein TNCV_2376201 [Trichonephila clavipes]|nr:hypothetical protein TNCV_2376201 [Trichonephila clavipes]